MTIPGEYRAARALDYFHQGYNCSQSVFTAFADVCGLTEETALRLSSPLGAGIGRMREVWCSPWPRTSRKNSARCTAGNCWA